VFCPRYHGLHARPHRRRQAKDLGIANDIVAAKPTPEVRFSLVAYRDRGDAYVTKRVELTDDLDAVYAQLREFQATGGGELSKEREAYLAAERARLTKEHKANGFDAQVAATLREQAKKKGIKYE
jgi:hypothetical protein